VGYLNDGRLAYARRDGGVYVVGARGGLPLFEWGMGKIFKEGQWVPGSVDQVVASGDGRWLAARPADEPAAGSQVKVRSLDDGAERVLRWPFGRYPDEIALDQTGERLVVGLSLLPVRDGASAKKPFAVEPPGEVVIFGFDKQTGNWRKTASTAVPSRPD